ncbi:hypothetical protein FACS1894151_03550 [Spirochaetia bacterium]|nr:hypothetical protein FACS1894151_03550 [Spirochaetia bacterium]
MPKITVENAEIAVTPLTTLVSQIKTLMTQARAAVQIKRLFLHSHGKALR